MKCRMCSQQLRRVGRLCSECERELERARRADCVVGEPGEVVANADAHARAEAGFATKLRTPRNVIALAFCVGIAAAGGAGLVQHDSSRTSRSVMLDFVPPAPAHRHEAPGRDAVAVQREPDATPPR